ncbi:MAG TPA: guanylate kinase [Steroidobacteraceae bacterium]
MISAPSGAGKTSLVKALLERNAALTVSVSHTTRAPRAQELQGREYWFVSPQEFQELLARGEFLEHARVFDNFYGTGRASVETLLTRGRSVILEIDWQGARQVRQSAPGCTTIFILPPSRAALEERLRNRRTDSDAVIARRLQDAVSDMSHYGEFGYVVVNDDFDTACRQLESILAGSGQALLSDRAELAPLLGDLLAPPA